MINYEILTLGKVNVRSGKKLNPDDKNSRNNTNSACVDYPWRAFL